MNVKKFQERCLSGKISTVEMAGIWKKMCEEGRVAQFQKTNPSKKYHPNGGIGTYINASKPTSSQKWWQKPSPKTGQSTFTCPVCGATKSNLWKAEKNGITICSYCADYVELCSICGKMKMETLRVSNTPSKYVCSSCLPECNGWNEFRPIIPSYDISEWEKFWRDNFNSLIAEWYLLHMRKVMPAPKMARGFSSHIRNGEVHNFENHIREREEKRFQELTDMLEEFFKKYIVVSCAGEARYFHMIDSGHLTLPSWLPMKVIIKSTLERKTVWKYAHWLYSKKNLSDLAVDLVHIFGLKWNSRAYGGEKWQDIALHLMNYLAGKMTKLVFVDQAVSLCHNGQIFLDKIGVDVYTTKSILDFKLIADDTNFLRLLRYTTEETNKRYWYLKEKKNLWK